MDRLYMTILWIDYTLYEYTTYVLHHVLKLVGVARTGPSEEERKLGAAEEVPLTQKKTGTDGDFSRNLTIIYWNYYGMIFDTFGCLSLVLIWD